MAKKKTGRPTVITPELKDQIIKWANSDKPYTLEGLARKAKIGVSTLKHHLSIDASFSDALKAGMNRADELVVSALHRRATGFYQKEETVVVVSDGQAHGSHVEKVEVSKYYEPNTTAAIFWLKNRQPDLWREKQEVEQTGSVTVKIDSDDANV